MVEGIARTAGLAMQLGTPEELPADGVAASFDRYENRHGTSGANTGISTE